MTAIAQDLRYAVRSLARAPGFVVTAVLILAMGIGGTAAMFSVLYGVLLRPLPYPASGRLVGLWEVHPGANAPLKNDLLTLPTYRAWQRASATLELLGAHTSADQILSDSAGLERVRVAVITPSVFDMLGVLPSRGRLFVAADAQA